MIEIESTVKLKKFILYRNLTFLQLPIVVLRAFTSALL